jgi:RND family efflux transporter MFP subunit
MKTGIAVLGVAVAVAACGGSHEAETPHSGTSFSGTGVPVQVQEIPVNVPVEGTVSARNRAEVTTRMMARVSSLNVEVGSRVRRGEILIRLGTEDIAANRAKAEAAVMVASAARDEAEKHADRMDALLAQDVVPQVQRDQAHLQLTQAESQLAMARATLQEVETAGSYASITAPFAGEVVARHIDEGDVAAPGMPLLVVEEAGPRDGRLAVPVKAAEGLEPGSLVRVTTLGGRSTEAPVRSVAGGADPFSKTVEVRVTLPADWPTGVSLTALVPAGTAYAVTVPTEAVVRRGQLTGVRVLTPDGSALRWIRLGRSVGEDRVEVLSGLSEGDQILVTPAETAASVEGSSVEHREATQ